MGGQSAHDAVTWLANWRARRSEPPLPPDLLTIKQVGDACGLPGPVIMLWVSRTWVEDVGWMFTAEQLQEAVTIAEEWRRSRSAPSDPAESPDPSGACEGDGTQRL